MELQLVNKQTTPLETTSTENTRNNMLTQVANSKGTEWMVSSYNAWQQRSPLASAPKRNTSSMMRVVSRMTPKEKQLNTVLAFSFRLIVLTIGLIVSGKVR